MRRLVATALLIAPLAVPAPAGGASGWQWPVAGEVITPYRNGSDPYAGGQHRGIDVAAPAGEPVRAATAGRVTFSGTAGSSGLTVGVRTADGGFDTSYLHLASVSVAKGDTVEPGARLGEVGTTGRRSVSRPHLHFGVREADSRHAYRDPLTLLPPMPPAPVREAPRGVPVAAPAPVRAPPRRERVPRAAPVRRRVPAGRRVRVPAARRVPRGAPARPTLAPRPVTPLGVARRVRGRAPDRPPLPELGPRPRPAPVPEERPAARPVPRGHAPAADARGPDLGLVLACLGLLAAAACVGGRASGSGRGARPAVRALLGRQ